MTEKDLYGNVHFISFFSSVLSRLAYFSDMNFLEQYNLIMGPVIPDSILKSIDSIKTIPEILNDESVFNLTTNINKYPIYTFEGKKYIAFNKYAEKINMINKEVSDKYTLTIFERMKNLMRSFGSVNYISIATSNYGEIYVVVDKRMPNSIWVIFRGTYSGKTAASYSKPSSIIPLYVGTTKDGTRESYLFGIFKLLTDSIHTIIEAMRYLVATHLKVTTPNKVKVFTTGHSLGGALSSIFSYVWMRVKTTAPYNASPYNIMSNEIFCGSLGAPRCFNNDISKVYCEYVNSGIITYLRIASRGDPVISLPLKTMYFSHPCSDSLDVKNGSREKVTEECNGLYKITLGLPKVEYTKSLECSNKKGWRYNIPNPLKHTIYLNILYRSAIDISKFLKSIGTYAEILKTPAGSSECRLIYYNSTNKVYSAVFFDLNSARTKPQPDSVSKGNIGFSNPKDVSEDDKVTSVVFDSLINSAININSEMKIKLPMQGPITPAIFEGVVPVNKVCITLSGGVQVQQAAGTRRKRRKNGKTRKN